MIIEDALYILFRKVEPNDVIQSWLSKALGGMAEADNLTPQYLYRMPNQQVFEEKLTDCFAHYTLSEAQAAYRYFNNLFGEDEDDLRKDCGIFGILSYVVENVFRMDVRRECLCKHGELVYFRELSHSIDPLLFQCAYLAYADARDQYSRRNEFSWPLSIRTDNIRLLRVLDKGMAENHFHLGGSSSAFMFSWICLMNHFDTIRAAEFQKAQLDLQRGNRDSSKKETCYSLTFKAACIRCFLYTRLNGEWICQAQDDEQSRIASEKWLLNCLQSTNGECDVLTGDLDNKLAALRDLCQSDNDRGFIPDYAMAGEPIPSFDDSDLYKNGYDIAVRNYERRLYRPLSGEQRFLYSCLYKIYQNDKDIMPYAELFYGYLLLYCHIRGLLIQNNGKYGFVNFKEYQDRKDTFTGRFSEYFDLRNMIAQQAVLSNPQVRLFEARFCPMDTVDGNLQFIRNMKKLAEEPYYSRVLFPNGEDKKSSLMDGCSRQKESDSYMDYCERLQKQVQEKLHYVLHFTKSDELESTDIYQDMTTPRNHKKRKQVDKCADAIIRAKIEDPDTMSLVSGIDACSNEIGCRPEVFACAFRRLRTWTIPLDTNLADNTNAVLTNCRLTYHVGEDFLCIIDGLRAIDEACFFLSMRAGDRLGHALALGINCEEWYSLKHYKIILPEQDLLDNLVWLYSKLHAYDIVNLEAEYEIINMFHQLYSKIYFQKYNPSEGSNVKKRRSRIDEETKYILASVNIDDYAFSMKLRGNDPELYQTNPVASPYDFRKKFADDCRMKPWRCAESKHGDYTNDNLKSNLLYHCYHYNSSKRKIYYEYTVKHCIVEAVCMVQKKLQYELSKKGIGIECNPSSNYLIGTFRDYAKHPIFVFNDKGLRDNTESPLLSTSINTDDLGVFDTCLENEYALLACALETSNLYSNNPISAERIYDWINNIRDSGCEQSFIRDSLRERRFQTYFEYGNIGRLGNPPF